MNRAKGFTLVEVAIVMIVIGLLIGGILKGQELLQTTRINRAISDLRAIESSIHIFRENYNAYPGDMRSANIVLNTAAGNGNGDGILDENEHGLVFEHLSYADLIPGDFHEVYGTSGEWLIGKTGPAGPISGSGYWVDFPGTRVSPSPAYGQRNHMIMFGAVRGVNLNGSILSPPIAMKMDLKMDDGSPSTGHLLAGNGVELGTGSSTRCTDSSAARDFQGPAGSAGYNLSNVVVSCRIFYVIKNW